jgi:CheY-like chemotaxis protein
MGSDIQVESEVGQGSVFRFTLDVPVVNSVAIFPPVAMVTGYQGSRKKVLVVDDIVENRTLLVDLLGQIGFEMAEATNGREAVQVTGSFNPDLILMDVYMPEMDGLDAIRLLRQLPRFAEVPIIAVSASASGSDEDTCLASGADAFLPKPVDMDKLLKHIAHLLKLEWVCEPSEVGKTPPQTSLAPLTIPPQEEMALLHQMALQGNMREIIQYASHLAELDERYHAFVDQLQLLARGYQSKTLLSFVERYLNRKASQ